MHYFFKHNYRLTYVSLTLFSTSRYFFIRGVSKDSLTLNSLPLFSIPCQVGLVVSMSASHTVSREFASRPGHTKDHHKNGTNCLPAWHAIR